MNMCSTFRRQPQRGFSFVEVLVTAALVALVFGGLFASVRAMIALISDSKAKAGAVALATERLEYIRSLSYDAVGTVGAPPFGAIPQNRTVTLNDLTYTERIVIRYEDDPRDGLGGADANGIITDYKKVKVEYSWPNRTGTSTIALSTNVVPPGVETSVGGGTLRVYVNDAAVLPVANAEVTVLNTTLATTTNTTQFANGNGEFILSGLPAGSNYNISVTLPGYSTDGTATPTPPLSSPVQPVVSIATSSVTTQYFQIDRLSDLVIETVASPSFGDVSDTFSPATTIATSSTTTVSGGSVVLAGGPGSYAATGTVTSTSVAPTPLASWYTATADATTSASTTVRLQLLSVVGTSTSLIPDTDLPGNSAGFTSFPVDLRGLDVSTYPAVALRATLTSRDSTYTPALREWSLTHVATEPVLSGIPMRVVGAKVLGTDISGGPVFKNRFTGSTDGSGVWSLAGIEYDQYTIAVDDPTYDVLEACPLDQLNLDPNTSETMTFTIGTVAGPRVRVGVRDVAGNSIAGASVRLQQGGFDQIQTTSLCGQTFFSGGGLSVGTSTVTVEKGGYTTLVDTGVPVHASSSVTLQIN